MLYLDFLHLSQLPGWLLPVHAGVAASARLLGRGRPAAAAAAAAASDGGPRPRGPRLHVGDPLGRRVHRVPVLGAAVRVGRVRQVGGAALLGRHDKDAGGLGVGGPEELIQFLLGNPGSGDSLFSLLPSGFTFSCRLLHHKESTKTWAKGNRLRLTSWDVIIRPPKYEGNTLNVLIYA